MNSFSPVGPKKPYFVVLSVIERLKSGASACCIEVYTLISVEVLGDFNKLVYEGDTKALVFSEIDCGMVQRHTGGCRNSLG